jgi:hypothetical protein
MTGIALFGLQRREDIGGVEAHTVDPILTALLRDGREP